ncbi:hypothetical protein DSO57_1036563 [Entomophthora muscae]|uniref:Uncharacterized protein n=1 Tax=Entomophthora muscae TaxID=34485 RepID=A0ACC2S1D4_9FUNG|nr:hypothetical protein DSO57_1036563 [Entomophthora muscae]
MLMNLGQTLQLHTGRPFQILNNTLGGFPLLGTQDLTPSHTRKRVISFSQITPMGPTPLPGLCSCLMVIPEPSPEGPLAHQDIHQAAPQDHQDFLDLQDRHMGPQDQPLLILVYPYGTLVQALIPASS